MSYDNSVLNILRNCQLFSKWLKHFFFFTFSPAMSEGSYFSAFSQKFVIICRLILVILVGVEWCLTVVLICNSLVTNYIKHLFMCWLDICISSVEKYLFRFFAHFLIGWFIILQTNLRVLYIFWEDLVFSPILWVVF